MGGRCLSVLIGASFLCVSSVASSRSLSDVFNKVDPLDRFGGIRRFRGAGKGLKYEGRSRTFDSASSTRLTRLLFGASTRQCPPADRSRGTPHLGYIEAGKFQILQEEIGKVEEKDKNSLFLPCNHRSHYISRIFCMISNRADDFSKLDEMKYRDRIFFHTKDLIF